MSEEPSASLDQTQRLIEQGDTAEAIRALQQMLRGAPDSFAARLKLAEAYRLKAAEGDPLAQTMALREFERALRIVPGEEQAHASLGNLAVQLGQASRLRREYEGRFKELPFAVQCARVLDETKAARRRFPGFGGLLSVPVFVALLISAAAVGFWLFNHGDPVFTKPVSAEGFVLRDLAGETVSLSDFTGEKVVILDFWATWCPPCRASMPALARLRDRYSGRDVEVLSVNLEESAERVRGFISAQGLNLRVLLDSDGSVARSYRVHGIPTVLVIDKNGRERERVVGYRPDLESYLEKSVNSLL